MGLWPTCEVPAAPFRLRCLQPSASQQREQAGPTGCQHSSATSLPRAAPPAAPRRQRACSAPSGFPRRTARLLGPAQGLLLHGAILGPTNQRESGQRCWIATGLSGDCRSSLGLEGRGGVIDYHPFHFHRACQVSIQVLWPTCKVQADFGQDKGGKQKPQGVTARTWLPHPEPLLLGRPMPQAPYTPD